MWLCFRLYLLKRTLDSSTVKFSIIFFNVSFDEITVQIWPPKSVKDSGSRLHSKLKEAIIQVIYEVDSIWLSHFLLVWDIVGVYFLTYRNVEQACCHKHCHIYELWMNWVLTIIFIELLCLRKSLLFQVLSVFTLWWVQWNSIIWNDTILWC